MTTALVLFAVSVAFSLGFLAGICYVLHVDEAPPLADLIEPHMPTNRVEWNQYVATHRN